MPLRRDYLEDDVLNMDDILQDSEENNTFEDDLEMEEAAESAGKPMSDDKLKLECLKIAINVAKLANRKDVITVADELFKFCRTSNL